MILGNAMLFIWNNEHYINNLDIQSNFIMLQ